MQRPEKTIAALLVPGVLVISLYTALSYLPLLTVRDLDVSHPCASVMSILLPMKGRSFLSASRNAVVSEIASLPYVEDVMMRYGDGILSIRTSLRNDGIALISDKRAALIFSDALVAVDQRDIPMLSEVYPVVGMDDSYLEYALLKGLPESMLGIIRASALASGSTCLITWMEYGNNSNSGSPVLTLTIPDLNADLSIMDADAASRIEESLSIIEDEYNAAGSGAVFGERAHYGLYSDRLIRIKRQ